MTKLSKHATKNDSVNEDYSYSDDDWKTGKHCLFKYHHELHTESTIKANPMIKNVKKLLGNFRKIKRGKYTLCSKIAHKTAGIHDYSVDETSEGGNKYKTTYRHIVDPDPNKCKKTIIHQSKNYLTQSVRYNPDVYNEKSNKMLDSSRKFLIDCHKDGGLYDTMRQIDSNKWIVKADEMVKNLFYKHFWLTEETDRNFINKLSNDLNDFITITKPQLEKNINENKTKCDNNEIQINNLNTNLTGEINKLKAELMKKITENESKINDNKTKITTNETNINKNNIDLNNKINNLQSQLDKINENYEIVLNNANMMYYHIMNLEIMIENLATMNNYLAKQCKCCKDITKLDEEVEFKAKPYEKLSYKDYKTIPKLPCKNENKKSKLDDFIRTFIV